MGKERTGLEALKELKTGFKVVCGGVSLLIFWAFFKFFKSSSIIEDLVGGMDGMEGGMDGLLF